MLIFVLLSKKHLVVSVWIFFKYFDNHSKLEKNKTTKIFVDVIEQNTHAGI